MQKGLLKAGTMYTLCNIVLRGISFVTTPLFIRLLTPEEFGKYNVFISFESIMFIFSGMTIHASIKNAFYDKKDTYEDYIKSCIYFDIVNSLLITIILSILFLWKETVIGLSYIEINLIIVSGFCQAAISVYSAKLIMEYKSGDFIVISLLTVCVGISLSLLFIFTLFASDHYLGRVWGGVCGQIAATLLVLYKIFKNGISTIKFSDWKYGLSISWPIIPHGLSQIALSSANRIMIKYVYGATYAGIFSFTYTVSLIPQILFNSVSNVWEPWFFEKMDKKDYKSISNGSINLAVLISACFLLMSCIVPEIVKILATEEYYDAMDISIIVLIGCYFATLYYIPCEVEYFYKKTKYIAVSTFLCAVINIGLNFVLMQYFNYKIAAYVTMIAYFLYFLFHSYMTYYICRQWIFPIGKLALLIIVSCLLMGVCLMMIDFLLGRLLLILLILLLLVVFYRSEFQAIMEYVKRYLH